MLDIIIHYFSALFLLTAEMAPYLLLGFLMAGLLKVYVPQKFLVRNLGQNNFKSVFYGALIGVPLPLCSCGVIPTGVSLKNNGASSGATISFLISTPQTGVDSILITYSLMGWPFALLRPFAALLTGIFGGLLSNFFNRNNADSILQLDDNQLINYPNRWSKFVEMMRYAFVDFMGDIAKWLTVGLLLAALVEVVVPDSFIVQYLGNPWLEMAFALLISIPLYICATGSVPLAAVLMIKGLSPGAAFILLMAGPATNLATITVIGKALGRKSLFVYLFAIVFGAFVFGYLINLIFPPNYSLNFLMSNINLHSHHHLDLINLAFFSLLAGLVFYSLFNRYFKSKPKVIMTNDLLTEFVIHVDNMSCKHCEANVVKNLSALPDMHQVVADSVANTITFNSSNPDFQIIENLVNSLGYSYKGIK